jgi:hypothetical protein
MKARKRDVIGLLQLVTILRRLSRLLKTPVFWLFTIFGNALILVGALLFREFESQGNPLANDILECLIWSMGMVTTVGASNLHPATFEGKILMIFIMMGGALFLWSYMALFIGALVDPELRAIETEVSEIQRNVKSDDEILRELQRISSELDAKIGRLNKG